MMLRWPRSSDARFTRVIPAKAGIQASSPRKRGPSVLNGPRVLCATLLTGVSLLLIPACKQESGEPTVTSAGVAVVPPAVVKREANKQEAEKLQQYSKFARRNGATLELTLSDGKVKPLTDRREAGREADVILYDFVDYLEDIDHFLVRLNYYEGGDYAIVNRKYGSMMQLDDVPILAPDRKHFLTASICDAYCANRLQIWKRQGDGGWYEMVWSFSPNEYWTGATAKWIDPSAIEVTAEVAEPATGASGKVSHAYVKRPLHVRLNRWGWNLTEN